MWKNILTENRFNLELGRGDKLENFDLIFPHF